MKARDIFKLAVRILGLVFIYYGLTAVPVAASAFYTAATGAHGLGFFMSLVMVGWPLAVAYWLLRGAPLIVHIAYPNTAEPSQGEMGGACGQKVDA